MNYTHQFYAQSTQLPAQWNAVVAKENLLFSKEYFQSLEAGIPNNMKLYFVAFFKEEELIGGGLFQFLDFHQHSSFNYSKSPMCTLRNLMVKLFTSRIIILGNNLLSGQNGYYFSDKINLETRHKLLTKAFKSFHETPRKNQISILKDVKLENETYLPKKFLKKHYPFTVQPTMILNLKEEWKSFEDYYQAFQKKYKARIRTARKKGAEIDKQELSLTEVKKYEAEIHQLYLNVAENAPFNTFFLPKNHFYELKNQLKDKFQIFGYFLAGKLVGFYTIINNVKELETYFLGYDAALQKEKQLYLNMLIDMVEYGIQKQYQTINFGRTALEIKSTIGAEPVQLLGFMKHKLHTANAILPKVFKIVEPKQEFIQRKPFKEV